jgi:hypothetical protein
MKSIANLTLKTTLAAAVLCWSAYGAEAQDNQQSEATTNTPKKPAAKPHKVWTDDEVRSLRTPEDTHVEAVERKKEQAELKQKQQAEAARAPQEPAQSEEAKKQAIIKQLPPKFANPKSLNDVDGAVDWEKRDIAAQEEGLEKLKVQVDEAPAEDKARLNKLLEERTRILADTREELKVVEEKKKQFEKPQAQSSNDAAPSQPAPQR